MSYKGKYSPNNPAKYRGNVTKIVYRSLWERKFMVYCDQSDSIIEWGSEEIIIPYLSPWDGKQHRYYPDFYIKVKQNDGKIKKYIIEVKPKKQCSPPNPKPTRKTILSYLKNLYGRKLLQNKKTRLTRPNFLKLI